MKAPASVWEAVEASLNTELVAQYAARQALYKRALVAAVFVAFLSWAFYFVDAWGSGILGEERSYNALVDASAASDFGGYDRFDSDSQFSKSHHELSLPIWYRERSNLTLSASNESSSSESGSIAPLVAQVSESGDADDELPMPNVIEPARPPLEIAAVVQEIYPYRQSFYAEGAPLSSNTNKVHIAWAGLEAGAGSFNSNLNDYSTVTNSVNPSALARAVGDGSAVNPTTESVSPEMESGLLASFGLDIGLSLGKKWILESGIAYASAQSDGAASVNVVDVYSIDSSDDFQTASELQNSSIESFNANEASVDVKNYDYEVGLNSTLQFATFPLKAGYYVVDRKMSLRLNAGVAANYITGAAFRDQTGEIIVENELVKENEWSMDWLGGIEVGYLLGKKFNVTLEPSYRASVTPLASTVSAPSRFMLQTGVQYTIR